MKPSRIVLIAVAAFVIGIGVGAEVFQGGYKANDDNDTIAINTCVEQGGVPLMSSHYGDEHSYMVDCKLPYKW